MNSLFERIWEKKITFLVTFFIVFSATYLLLVIIDFLPEPKTEEVITAETGLAVEAEVSPADTKEEETIVEEVAVSAYPLTISIAKLDKEIKVLNPQSRSIADLDAALLDGVVRHPDSATLSQEGNVFILGHSSYLPTVLNRNFQAFNGIQNLEWGDTIELSSEDAVYTYRVEKVYRAKASEVTVPIADTGNMLTLATCNSFGSIDDRYIVEAKRVDVSVL